MRGRSVRWADSVGIWRVDDDPEVHAGLGQTLAFRRFGVDDLAAQLVAAGFAAPEPVEWHDEFGVPEAAFPGVYLVRKPATASAPI